MKTRHVDCPRSAIIVFRFVIIFGEVSEQASYAGIAYAVWVSLRTPHIPRSGLPRGEAGRFGYCDRSGLSIYFRTIPFISIADWNQTLSAFNDW